MTDDAARQAARRLGAYIKKRREERGLGIRQLARMAGMDPGGLTRLEHGQYVESPRLSAINGLARALDVPVTDLLNCIGCDTSCNIHDCLRTTYQLPEEGITAATAYLERLAAEYSTHPPDE